MLDGFLKVIVDLVDINMKLQLEGHKLNYHLEELLKWKRGELFPPLLIEFGPVSGCLHHCVHCYVQEYIKKIEYIKDYTYLKFMTDAGDYGVKSIILSGCGEPLMHKMTPRAIEIGKEHGLDIGMFTNGVLINDKNIDRLLNNLTFIRLSINGFSKGTYMKVHRCPERDWNRIIENIKKLVTRREELNSNCTIGIYSLLLNENMYEIYNWIKQVRDLGVDYIIIKPPGVGLERNRFVELPNYDDIRDIFPLLESLSTPEFKVQIRKDMFESGEQGCIKNYDKCYGLPFMCAVDADGEVYTCNWFFKNKNYSYGNLNKNSFKEIWEGYKIESECFDMSKCGLCRQNTINNFLYKLKNPPIHTNFI